MLRTVNRLYQRRLAVRRVRRRRVPNTDYAGNHEYDPDRDITYDEDLLDQDRDRDRGILSTFILISIVYLILHHCIISVIFY